MPAVYGIPTCSTVRKARAALETIDRPYSFHDYRELPALATKLDQWLKLIDWSELLNRRSTTWRQLGTDERASVVDAPSARALMLAYPTLIKRPVVEWPGGELTIGFDPKDWKRLLGS
jgi:Spx/MgsR family transcriptional regulator